MSDIKVVIPWRPHPSRERGLAWVSEYYRHRLGEDCVHVEVDDSDRPFNRSKTINQGVLKFPDATVVIGDADCIICDHSLRRAVSEVDDRMIVPHNSYCKTTPAQAEQLLCMDPKARVSGKMFRRRRSKRANAGIWVVRASLFLEHMMDEEFEGWGCEDTEFLTRMPIAPRFNGPLFHIWHKRPSKKHYRKNRRMLFEKAGG